MLRSCAGTQATVSLPNLLYLQWSRQALPAARFHWRHRSGKPTNLSGVC